MANPGPASTVTIHPQNVLSNQAVRLLAVATGVNVNSTGDVAVLNIANSSNWSVANVVFTNASISLTTAAAGVFTAPGASGAIVSNAALSAMTGSTIVSQRTVASTAINTGQYLYINVGTAQGAAATMDVYIYGYDFATYS
jgi:hypothetical protein